MDRLQHQNQKTGSRSSGSLFSLILRTYNSSIGWTKKIKTEKEGWKGVEGGMERGRGGEKTMKEEKLNRWGGTEISESEQRKVNRRKESKKI